MEHSLGKDKKFCECGCGTEIEILNCRRQPKRFVKGHNVVNFVKHGPEHPSWKGGRTLDKDGYVLIWYPSHHRAVRGGGYVLEHILVMEVHLNAWLLPWVIVHHINEIKTDNRIENLMLLTDSQHKSYHSFKLWRERRFR